MTSNLRIYIRSMQDKFQFFSFLNDFVNYLKTNFVFEKDNFFENKVIAKKIKSAQKDYEIKRENIFTELNEQVGINFVK